MHGWKAMIKSRLPDFAAIRRKHTLRNGKARCHRLLCAGWRGPKTVIISERMQRHPAILIITQVFIIFRSQVPWHLQLFYQSVRVIKFWIFVPHRAARAQSLGQGFRERDCWFPMISATPGAVWNSEYLRYQRDTGKAGHGIRPVFR